MNRISKKINNKTKLSKSKISKNKLSKIKSKTKTIKRKAGFCCNEFNRLLFGSAYGAQSTPNESVRSARSLTKEQVRSLNKRHNKTMKEYNEKRLQDARIAWIKYIQDKEAHLSLKNKQYRNYLDEFGLEKTAYIYASPKTKKRYRKIKDDCSREGLYVPELHEIIPRFHSSSSEDRDLEEAWLKFNRRRNKHSIMRKYAQKIHDAHKIKDPDDVYEDERSR
jgi:hypothetical protein